LCIHGCDHTFAEFAGTEHELFVKAEKALDRMTAHEQLTGLPFDRVMVFPQGIFSPAAFNALRNARYLAAVNTTPFPKDGSGHPLKLLQLLDVAIAFSDVPLFQRRYPHEFADLAFDLFLGRPAFLVEHHGFFRDGYGPLVDVVEKLNALEKRLHWDSLGTICAQACVKRVDDSGDMQVRFFCDRFRLENDTDAPQRYVLLRQEAPAGAIVAVNANYGPVDYQRAGDVIRIPYRLAPGDKVEVQIERASPKSPVTGSGQVDRRAVANVYLRRRLCEFRDNHVQTNLWLNRLACLARRLVT
jgi:hypothetical protein